MRGINAPLHLADRFAPLDTELIALLRGLGPDDWVRPTACALWTVKDIAAHLLDGNFHRLSFQRDGLPAELDVPIHGYPDLMRYLDRLNAEWVSAARRISPPLLIDLLEHTGMPWAPLASRLVSGCIRCLIASSARCRIGIATSPPNRAPSCTSPSKKPRGGDWTLQRGAGGWRLCAGASRAPAAGVRMDRDTAWRLFSKGLSPAEARERVMSKAIRRSAPSCSARSR